VGMTDAAGGALPLTIEEARALVYDGSIWELGEGFSRAEGIVAAYITEHVMKRECAGVIFDLAIVEKRAPWRLLEPWILGQAIHPYTFRSTLLPPERSRFIPPPEEVDCFGQLAWLETLRGRPTAGGERHWRTLLCALSHCRDAGALYTYIKTIDEKTHVDSDGDVVVGDVMAFNGDDRVYFSIAAGYWSCRSMYSARWDRATGRYGPMGFNANDGFINRPEQFIAIARQLSIEVPQRVLALHGGVQPVPNPEARLGTQPGGEDDD
jgi:hypothetical protein